MPIRELRTSAALSLLATSALIVWAATASAQIHPDAKTGKQIAEKLCVGCHIVGPIAEGTVPADVPSFMRIANEPGQSAERIAGAIVIPHPPMPTIHLTREEIGDVAAYILTLKK
ncbi:MAG TPA: cytochrome c [Hyphomicrobium sp.]|nr:cytochrome c [Hyphomicrobium sp.]